MNTSVNIFTLQAEALRLIELQDQLLEELGQNDLLQTAGTKNAGGGKP